MAGRLSKLVMIWIRAANGDQYRQYEARAAERIALHGGRVVRQWSVEGWSGDQTQRRAPDEVHIIEFPNQEAFDAYMSAPDTIAAIGERDELVEQTVIVDLREDCD